MTVNEHDDNAPTSHPSKDAPTSAPLKSHDEAESDSPRAVFEELEPQSASDPIDRSVIIGRGVTVLAQWCLRILIIAVAAFVGWYIIKQFWQGILPVILALIVCTVLWPPVAFLKKRLHFPAALASIVVILGAFCGFGLLIWLIAPNVGRQSQTLYYQALDGIQRAQLWLQGPPLNLDDAKITKQIDSAINWLQKQAGNIAGEIFSGLGMATSVVVTLGVVLILTFFFLKDGNRFLPWVRGVVGTRAGWHLTELLTRCWNTLGGFIRAQALVSLVDAVFIGLGLIILGVPLALALAVLTFIAGFIPIVGAFVAGALAVVIALVSLGVTKAIITLLIVLAVQQLEGNILSPLLQSRAMNLHPVIILFSVTVGSSLFGIVGAFLAVPTAAMIAVVFRYLNDMISLRSGDKTADQIHFVTTAGSLSGKYDEEAGRKMREAFISFRNKNAHAFKDKNPVSAPNAPTSSESTTPKDAGHSSEQPAQQPANSSVSNKTAHILNRGAKATKKTIQKIQQRNKKKK